MNPGMQRHWYPPTLLTQVAPFLHGFVVRHSFTSERTNRNVSLHWRTHFDSSYNKVLPVCIQGYRWFSARWIDINKSTKITESRDKLLLRSGNAEYLLHIALEYSSSQNSETFSFITLVVPCDSEVNICVLFPRSHDKNKLSFHRSINECIVVSCLQSTSINLGHNVFLWIRVSRCIDIRQ